MPTQLRHLKAAFDVILAEARSNKQFAARLNEALSGGAALPLTRDSDGPSSRGSHTSGGPLRKSSRRAPAPIDPFIVLQQGELQLRSALNKLDVEQLKDVVAEHGMDRSRLALKWKSPERLVDLIVQTVTTRARKGSAFSGEPQPNEPRPSEPNTPTTGLSEGATTTEIGDVPRLSTDPGAT